MIDILTQYTGPDIGLADTEVERGANLLSIQIGALEYAPTWGIDLTFFLDPDYKFQNDSFKAYLLNQLANNSINVASLVETVHTFYSQYTFNLTEQAPSSGLIAR